MKKILMLVALAVSCYSVVASDLSEAEKQFNQGNYAQALQQYTKLADAGDVLAQLKVGEMYWYGEAGAIDAAKADFWLKKAAGQGSEQAKALLSVMAQRESRKKDIEYFTRRFDGGDVQFAKSGCVLPKIPPVSETNPEIKRVNEELKNWNECYNRFSSNFQKAMPPGKAIPADLIDVMNAEDIEQAKQLMEKTYTAIIAEVSNHVSTVNRQYQVWQGATKAYAARQNEVVLREREAHLSGVNKPQARDTYNLGVPKPLK